MTRKIILSLSILSIVLTAGIAAVEASDNNATWREIVKEKMAEFKNMTPEERKAQKEESIAFWTELKSSEEWENATSEEKKEMIMEAAGEQGIFPLRGVGRKFRHGAFDKEEFIKHHQVILDALEAENYEAWLEATEGRKSVENVSEDDFVKLVEAHKLMKEGDKEGAKEIMKELGLHRNIKAIKAYHKGHRKGFHHGFLKGSAELEK